MVRVPLRVVRVDGGADDWQEQRQQRNSQDEQQKAVLREDESGALLFSECGGVRHAGHC